MIQQDKNGVFFCDIIRLLLDSFYGEIKKLWNEYKGYSY